MSPRRNPGRKTFGMPAPPANRHRRFGSRGTRALSKLRKGVIGMGVVQDHPQLSEVAGGSGQDETAPCGCHWTKLGVQDVTCRACDERNRKAADRRFTQKMKWGDKEGERE